MARGHAADASKLSDFLLGWDGLPGLPRARANLLEQVLLDLVIERHAAVAVKKCRPHEAPHLYRRLNIYIGSRKRVKQNSFPTLSQSWLEAAGLQRNPAASTLACPERMTRADTGAAHSRGMVHKNGGGTGPRLARKRLFYLLSGTSFFFFQPLATKLRMRLLQNCRVTRRQPAAGRSHSILCRTLNANRLGWCWFRLLP